jgi:hypothetical protein
VRAQVRTPIAVPESAFLVEQGAEIRMRIDAPIIAHDGHAGHALLNQADRTGYSAFIGSARLAATSKPRWRALRLSPQIPRAPASFLESWRGHPAPCDRRIRHAGVRCD